MKQSSTANPIRKKQQSATTSTSHCLPSKKSSIIYKSIYLNVLDKSKEDTGDHFKPTKDRSRDHRQVPANQNVSKSKKENDSQMIKPSAHGNTLIAMQNPVGIFNRLGSKGTLTDNFIAPNNPQSSLENTVKAQVSKNTFIYHYIIGKGGFGKVWKVESKKNRQHYALKQMLKSLVMTKKSVQSVMNQRTLLANLNHPFVVNMHYAFQDRQTLYLVMDLMPGGDLRYHIGSKKKFTQVQSKFFIACIVLGLEYLHHQKIIHRDIKPQNLVLDSRGYVRITDLGIARVFKPINSMDTSGTPGYMSPEVLCRQNHEYVSDFFALGVIAYELMFGKRPYTGKTRKQIRDQVLAKQVQIKRSEVPEKWSYEAADFINRLIQRKPQSRLGHAGIEQVKQHPWLRQLNWKKIFNKQIESPFIPVMKKDNFDQDEQITIDDEEQAQLIEKNALLLRKTAFQDLFNGYYYQEIEKSQRGDRQKHEKKDIDRYSYSQKAETEPSNTTEMSFNIATEPEQPRKHSKPGSHSNTLTKDVTPPAKHSHESNTIKLNDLVLSSSYYRRVN